MVIHIKDTESGQRNVHRFTLALCIISLFAAIIFWIIAAAAGLTESALGTISFFGGFFFSLAVFFMIASTIFIFQPTDIAVKIRWKNFTKKVYKGKWGYAIPKIERFVIYDSRTHTIWLKFVGPRGANRNQMKDLDTYKKRVLIVDENQYWIENPEEKFSTSDFHEFGALVTAGREELNVLCSLNYRLIDPLKLSKVFDQLENSETEKGKFKAPLVTKIASALRSTMARMTLDEIFEERQKLMELLIRDSSDLNEQWGIEIQSVAIEEMWLEDEKLQDMLDERKKYEIIGDAQQLRETHEAEMRNMIIKSEEESKTMQAKAKDEARIIAQRTQQDIALLQQELVKLQAQIDIMSVEAQSKGKVMIGDAQAQRKKMIDEVTDSKILIHEFIKMLPQLVEQVSFDEYQKFTLVPSKKQGLLTAGVFGMQSEKKSEEEE